MASVKIDLTYTGDLHCEAVHGPSGARLTTDAPVDNQGRGESFSPTDLVATALGSCLATILGIQARTSGIDLRGLTVEVEKEMSADPPRRIARLGVTLRFPPGIPEKYRPVLRRATQGCPVHHSLRPDLVVEIREVWL